mgnify:CR=1 FL=1
MLVFGVSLQLAAYLLWAFNILGAIGITYPFGSADQLNNISGVFSLTPWTALIGGVGAIIGIVALLLRAGTYAIYAVLIFAVGVFFSVLSPFFLAIPNTIAALIPGTTNPFSYVNGTYVPTSSFPNPIATVIGVIFAFAVFFFVFEMVLQRKVS